ncbi:hypothetical protein F5X99DRAFT_396303 [Biscogniauxia marginata]|nr:hypothetical protein F5X99DRAFT_396303 [Biscogniauxia marginata]
MRAPLFPPPQCSLVQRTVTVCRGRRGTFFPPRRIIAPRALRAINFFRLFESPKSSLGETGSGQEPLLDGKEKEELNRHLKLLQRVPHEDAIMDIASAPIFTYPVLKHTNKLASKFSNSPFSQYALFAADVQTLARTTGNDPRVFYNVTTPTSFFICGSQGSGKSHSLSCILESCLIPSENLGRLPNPLTGIVFHYDNYISDENSTPCEAAYIASDPRVKVRVLCSPTNINTIRNTYSSIENVTVEELRLDESDLNTKRMLDLMGFGDKDPPLYMHVIQSILRDMRITQQKTGRPFRYRDFIERLNDGGLKPSQAGSLQQRLDILESFMIPEQIKAERRMTRREERNAIEAEKQRRAIEARREKKKIIAEQRRLAEEGRKARRRERERQKREAEAKAEGREIVEERVEEQVEQKAEKPEEQVEAEKPEEQMEEQVEKKAEEPAEESVDEPVEQLFFRRVGAEEPEKVFGTDWTLKAGELIIVDLSCPCITSAMACSLFNICLSIFLGQETSLGRVVALDEAHKYMDQTADSAELTESLISAIRLQRHLGVRIVISTQEPTISPKLLDLSSVAIIHRFTSPDWFKALKKHLAGVSLLSKVTSMYDPQASDESKDGLRAGNLQHEDLSPDKITSQLFARIVKLKTGEALVFAPNAVVDLEEQECPVNGVKTTHKRLSHDVMHVSVRGRITADGGRSIMAS